MKKLCIALCALLFPLMAISAIPTIHVLKEKSQLPLADPFVLFDNGVYYAYGTHSDDGIEVYTSSDLKIWRLSALALDKKNITQTRWFWAPEVYHIGNLYYMYYSANEHLYAATSTSPLGPFQQVGKEPFLPEGSIDGTLFRDDDGHYYFFFVRFSHGICMARMNDDLTSIQTETIRPCIEQSQNWEMDPLFPQSRVNEGPFVLKHHGKYYLTYSANDYRSQHYGLGLATATNIMGPWTKSVHNPFLQNVGGLVGTGHHAFFFNKKGKLMLIFHAHQSTQTVSPRLSYFIDAKFSGQTIKIGKNILVPRLIP